MEDFCVLLAEAQGGKSDASSRRVEQAHDHLFSVMSGQGGDSQIKIVVGDFDQKAPVLRGATLGDVHVGKNLNPGNHRGLKLLRNVGELAQDAVNTDPNGCRLTLRLDMDIARSLGRGGVENG